MSKPSGDGRSAFSVGFQWASTATTIGLEMVLPAVLGIWLDKKWGTSPWLVIVGAVLGFTVSMRHLLQLAERANKRDGAGKNEASR